MKQPEHKLIKVNFYHSKNDIEKNVLCDTMLLPLDLVAIIPRQVINCNSHPATIYNYSLKPNLQTHGF